MERGHQRGVDGNCAPRHNVRPSATTSNLRPSSLCVVCNVQISDEHIRRHSPSCFSADLCRCTLPRGNLFDPEPLLAHTLLDDGHGCPRSGNIGRCAITEEWGVEGVDTTRLGTTANRSCTPCLLGVLSTWRMREGRTVTFGKLDPPGRGLATPGSRRMCRHGLRGSLLPSNYPTPGMSNPCFHQAPLTTPHLMKTWCYWVVV